MEKTFSELVGEALGTASMAWSERPRGIFDSDTCCVLHIDIMNMHNEELRKLKATYEAMLKSKDDELVAALKELGATTFKLDELIASQPSID
jgi:hypothetical protein